MQSGISVSEELTSRFNELLSTPSHFALLATITGESLVPLDILPSSGTFSQNLDTALAPHLTPKQALYILLARHASAPRFVAVTYVPDSAPVRQKMLFASSRLTLVRELGSEHFRETVFATTAEELSSRGWERHEKHVGIEAPLTEEEMVLGEVKRAEAEAGMGSARREMHLGQKFATPVGAGVVEALREMEAEGSRGVLMLKINPEAESVELAESPASSPTTIPDLISSISATEPRFTFFRFPHTHNGEQSSPLLFFYTCPASEGRKAIKHRMMYPLMKRSVLAIAGNEVGLTVDKKFEVEEPSEITEEGVLEDLHPKVEAKKAFSRPKRPGR